MIEWVYVNTNKITRVGYNKEIETLYIDFSGSTFDTPYKNVSEKVFREFTQFDNVDRYYNRFIKNEIKPSLLDTISTVGYK